MFLRVKGSSPLEVILLMTAKYNKLAERLSDWTLKYRLKLTNLHNGAKWHISWTYSQAFLKYLCTACYWQLNYQHPHTDPPSAIVSNCTESNALKPCHWTGHHILYITSQYFLCSQIVFISEKRYPLKITRS